MLDLAYKMLIGNRASCLGVIFGIFLATLLISQQSAIFLGLLDRSYRVVTDIHEPTIWVMDPATQSEDKLRSMPLGYLDIVKGVPNVEWAVPFSFTSLPLVTPDGKFDVCQLYGIDDATLIGAPAKILEGSVSDLRRQGGVLVDVYTARKMPLKLGDTLEINGKRAVVVGICEVTQNFYPQPIMFSSFSQFQNFSPGMSNRANFILAKNRPGTNVDEVAKAISANPALKALTRTQFKDQIIKFFLQTGILINFGLSVLLGLIIGFSIAGQIFYIMTLENLPYYALIKAVGGSNRTIVEMLLFQAAIVGIVGFALGIGATVLWGWAIKNTTLAFAFPWQLLLFTGVVVLFICIFTALLSIQKVFRVDPKMLMGS